MGGTIAIPAWELYTALGVLGALTFGGTVYLLGWRAGKRRGRNMHRFLLGEVKDVLRASNHHQHTFTRKDE